MIESLSAEFKLLVAWYGTIIIFCFMGWVSKQ